jgi:hypothetical protein
MPKLFVKSAMQGKRAFVWALLFFACAELAMSLLLNGWRPELRDPAFGLRLHSLQKRRAENPTAPLVLVLGSSRTLHGLSPAHMILSPNGAGQTPLIYNFALTGSGSVRELMTFRRLRAAGIKPDWLLLESWPVFWPEDGVFAERLFVAADELCWRDLSVLSRYLPGKLELFAHALKRNLVPLICYRSRLMHAGAQFLLPTQQEQGLRHEDEDWTPRDETGWLPYRKNPSDAAAARREIEKGRLVVAPLLNPLRVAADSDRALRELLDECRTSGIKTALFLMPEHSECRRWYSSETRAFVSGYLRQLSQEYEVPVIDARAWSADEHFSDFCHMTPQGAQPFSERFGREVLCPWLQGKLLGDDVLLK